ncbi:hypothetical protein F511_29329 [Dorcoceras hygrometricum]|uniref:Uncharacterized protein n=1 Tax=Dorcoceras hygrometricum TaxID=472368 RepID=A0A2Z7A381_9LAMI|nr:hypothetical protein F511_29329 [Dorcoceras hygrometricum]
MKERGMYKRMKEQKKAAENKSSEAWRTSTEQLKSSLEKRRNRSGRFKSRADEGNQSGRKPSEKPDLVRPAQTSKVV